MVTALVQARVDGGRLSDDEIVSTVFVLLNAGHEASVNTLGNGMLAFARHPEQWRRTVDGSVPAAAAGEEMIRFDPPLQLFERWVLTDDFAIGDVQIPRGAKIALLFGAANRDPRVFERADEFDVARENAVQHIGFGGGIHVCIGAPLARIELEASLEALRLIFSSSTSRGEPARSSSGGSRLCGWRGFERTQPTICSGLSTSTRRGFEPS